MSIVKYKKINVNKKNKKGRKNVEEFYVLKTDVFLEGEKVCIRTTIRKDDKGKLYYDHVIKRPLGLFTGSTNPAVTSQRSNNSLTDTEYVVNIFFENKKGKKWKTQK